MAPLLLRCLGFLLQGRSADLLEKLVTTLVTWIVLTPLALSVNRVTLFSTSIAYLTTVSNLQQR